METTPLRQPPAAFEADEEPDPFGRPPGGWRRRLYVIIFESDTRAGWVFDIALIALIVLSLAIVIVDSMEGMRVRHGPSLNALEWVVTALFTLEYVLRLVCVERPARYARSVFGVIDLLALLPSYLALLFPETHALIDVRVLRLLRIFRILKLGAYIAEYRSLMLALAASRRKIFIFLSFVVMVVLVMGTLMYVVEGPENGFVSIPVSVYWAIVTLTTVGFGDITPKTDLGRFIASFQMLIGWGVLAVPTGIVSAEFTAQRVRRDEGPAPGRACPGCGARGHEDDSRHCRHCGAGLDGAAPPPR